MCPRCGLTQEDELKVRSDAPVPTRRGLARRLLTDLVDVISLAPTLALLLLALPLAIGGAIGYAFGGWNGTAAGVGAVIVLTIGAVTWAESRR